MTSKRRKWFIAVTGLAGIPVVFLILAFFLSHPEPSYNGQILGDWLWSYYTAQDNETQRQDAEAAVRAMGKATLPHLTRWVAYQPSRGMLLMHATLNPMIALVDPSRSVGDATYDRQSVATVGFKILGSEAASAVPELKETLHHGNKDTAALVAESLAYIGAPYAPSLESLLTDADPSVRQAATNALMAIADKASGRIMP